MKKFFKILLIAFVVLLFLGTFVYLFLNSQSHPDMYEVVSPAISDIERTTVLTGKIEPRDEIQIKPQVSGIISEIRVEPGDMVKAGDIIAVIKVIPDAAQLSSAQSRIDQAETALADARRKYERNKQLFGRKVIAREELETSQTTYEQAVNELNGARDAMRVVVEGVSANNSAEGSTHVRATISGLVLDVPVKVGASVIQSNTFNDGTTVATIADMTDLIFRGNVDETEVGLLKTGTPIEIEIGAMHDVHPAGVIEYISPKGTDTNGANTFEIKAALSGLPDKTAIRAGYSANATVTLEKVEKALSIAESCVEFSGDSTFVYVMTDSVPEQQWKRTPVKLGVSDGINVQIKKGLDKKQRVRGRKID